MNEGEKHEAVSDLTLMLAYLTSWDDTSKRAHKMGAPTVLTAWKGYDRATLDELREQGLIETDTHDSKLRLTDDGIDIARYLLEKYDLAEKADDAEETRTEAKEASVNATHTAQEHVEPDDEHTVPAYELRVCFDFHALTCVRTLLVPKDATFDDLHAMIQACLGFANAHPYAFYAGHGDDAVRVKLPEDDPLEDAATRSTAALTDRDAAALPLEALVPDHHTLRYRYGYEGGSWHLTCELTDEFAHLPEGMPVCTAGAGDAPCEELGGEEEFAAFLKTVDNPAATDYEDTEEWGADQGFERFNLKSANSRLAHWKEWKLTDDGQEGQVSA